MPTEIVNLRAQDGSLVGTAEIDQVPKGGQYPLVLAADDGRVFVRILTAVDVNVDAVGVTRAAARIDYVAAIPVAIIVRPAT